MKEFFKYVSATVVGMICFFLVFGILGVMSIIGMVASSEATTSVKENSVFVIKLDGMVSERSQDDFLGFLSGDEIENIGLDDLMSSIEKAKDNEDIKGIYLEAGMFGADPASRQALRNALLDFKKSGKWIVAYGDVYSQGAYHICSVADKVLLNPQGTVDWHGLCAEMYYVKDLLAKFGVKMQTTKVGAYKSAPEMFIADKMSEPNREQTTAFITGIWNQLVSDVAASRHITAAQLNQYADSLITFSDPKNYVAMKFVDKLVYTDQVKDEVKAMMKLGKDDDLNTLSLSDMRNVKSKSKEGDEIAVYYAEGDIVDEAAAGISSARGSQIVGEKVCKDLQKLADDEKVKAVVLRINSGGGSAYASEQMWHAIEMLKAKKPVVVSMSGYAASGGYYMSCNSNWIVAEPTTLTGSIGIFGMFPDFSQLLTEKLGVKFDRVKTNAHSDFGTPSRPFSAEEVAYLESYIDRGYELFRKRVADGRKMSVEDVEKIAQGHVWLGKDALKIKLVDELGGLDVAVAKAAKLAKLDEYYTSGYPAKSDFLDQLLDKTSSGAGSYIDGQLRATLGEYYAPFMLVRDINRHSAIQARIPYFINIK